MVPHKRPRLHDGFISASDHDRRADGSPPVPPTPITSTQKSILDQREPGKGRIRTQLILYTYPDLRLTPRGLLRGRVLGTNLQIGYSGPGCSFAYANSTTKHAYDPLLHLPHSNGIHIHFLLAQR